MSSAEFVIGTTTGSGTLFISVHVPRSVKTDEIDAFMTRLATAVAGAERIDEQLMEALLFESRSVIQCDSTLGVILSRDYSDPAYPERVDRELRTLGIDFVSGSRSMHAVERCDENTAASGCESMAARYPVGLHGFSPRRVECRAILAVTLSAALASIAAIFACQALRSRGAELTAWILVLLAGLLGLDLLLGIHGYVRRLRNPSRQLPAKTGNTP